jgi:hypothetical protein
MVSDTLKVVLRIDNPSRMQHSSNGQRREMNYEPMNETFLEVFGFERTRSVVFKRMP